MSSPAAGASAASAAAAAAAPAAGSSAGASEIVSSFGHLDIVSPGGPPAWIPSSRDGGSSSGGSGDNNAASPNVALAPDVAAAVAAAEEAAAAAERMVPTSDRAQVSMGPNEHRYQGEVNAEGAMHGYGKLAMPHAQYRGQFKLDKMHGRGVHVHADGKKLTGDFAKGACTGFAVIHFANGDVYRGKVYDGLPHGLGARYSPDGSVCEQGTFIHNQFAQPPRLPSTTMSFDSAERAAAAAVGAAEAARQAAAAVDALRPTPGAKQQRMTIGEVAQYVGETNGPKSAHGYGVCRSAFQIQSGRWSNGSLQLGRIMVNTPGSPAWEYRGELQNDRLHGVGVLTLTGRGGGASDGRWKYEGEMRNMQTQGHGVRTWISSGRKHAGAWRADKPHGFGIAYKADGSVGQKGWWQDGRFMGAKPPAGVAAAHAAARPPIASAAPSSAAAASAAQAAPGGPVIAAAAASSAALAVGVGEKQCAGCGVVKAKKRDFSATQGQKPGGKCKECVGGGS